MSVAVTEVRAEWRARVGGRKKGGGGKAQIFGVAGKYAKDYGWIDDAGNANFNSMGATWRDPARLAAAKATFDALPDDAVITLYHGTTPERAANIVATGRVEVPAGFVSELHTMAPQSMYVAPTEADAARYGDTVVTFKVRKADLVPSPETLAVEQGDPTHGSSTLARSLFGSFDGAILNPGQQLGMVNIVGAKPAPRVDLVKELVDNEGFTLNPRTGVLVRSGVAVAVQGHTGIIKAPDFMDGDKGRAFVRDYVHKMAAAKPSADTMVGGWYDREHDEIDLDWVEVFADRQAGISAGRQRNQMAVYDLGSNEEIPTGGTGDREAILAGAEARAAGRREAKQAARRYDLRGAGPLRRPTMGGDDGQPRKAQVVAQLLALDERAKSGLKKGAGGHEQLYGEHGKYAARIAPVSGQTAKQTVAVDLTLSVLPEAVRTKSTAQMQRSLGVDHEAGVEHLVAMAESALTKGLPGQAWYMDARSAALDSAKRYGIHPDVGVAVVAAMSPGTKWEENLRNAEAVMSMHAQWDQPIDPAHIDNVNVWAAKEDKTTKAPNSKSRAAAGDTLGQLYKKDPHLAAVYAAKKTNASAGYSYDNFFKAIDLVAVNDPGIINSTLNGAKVRSFFNNISEPTSTAGDVTIDVHMQRAMANDLDSTTPQQKHERMVSISKRSSSITGSPSYAGASLGAMPAMADVTREATRRFNQRHHTNLLASQFQAVVWTEQITQFTPQTVEAILKVPVP